MKIYLDKDKNLFILLPGHRELMNICFKKAFYFKEYTHLNCLYSESFKSITYFKDCLIQLVCLWFSLA